MKLILEFDRSDLGERAAKHRVGVGNVLKLDENGPQLIINGHFWLCPVENFSKRTAKSAEKSQTTN